MNEGGFVGYESMKYDVLSVMYVVDKLKSEEACVCV